MAYRASSIEPKTRWARHLDQVMRTNDWSRVRLFEEVGPEMGYGSKSRSAILPLLDATNPTPEQARVLRKHFGDPLEVEPSPAPVPALDPYAVMQAHADAMTAQAAAFNRLAASIDAAAAGVTDRVDQFGALLEGVVLLQRQLAEAASARTVVPAPDQ